MSLAYSSLVFSNTHLQTHVPPQKLSPSMIPSNSHSFQVHFEAFPGIRHNRSQRCGIYNCTFQFFIYLFHPHTLIIAKSTICVPRCPVIQQSFVKRTVSKVSSGPVRHGLYQKRQKSLQMHELRAENISRNARNKAMPENQNIEWKSK